MATLSSINPPRRSEVWLVNLDPTVGTELKKIRPAVVISSNAVGRLPIKLVAPITDWKDNYARHLARLHRTRFNKWSLKAVHCRRLAA